MADEQEPSVDDKHIQRILFYTSDILGAELIKDSDLLKNRIVNLIAQENNTFFLNSNNQLLALKRQHELFSDCVIPSDLAAHQIFKDNETPTPIDTNYSIHNFIVLHLDNEAWFFNIDKVNKENQQFFISKLKIRNESKDIFTLKANYKVNLTVNFTSFDDLLANNVTVSMLKDPTKTKQIPLMQILYKFFNQPTGNQKDKNRSDPEGIFLYQILRFPEPHERFKALRDELRTDEICKTYHLTYFKHNFEMFKNEETFFKFFENELLIEYVAYEADGVDKPVPKETAAQTLPKVNSNLYKLLKKEIFDKTGIKEDHNLGGAIYEFDDIINSIDRINESINYLKCKQQQAKTEEDKAKYKKKMDDRMNSLQKMKTIANRTLIFTLLNYVQMYKLKIPYKLLGVAMHSNFSEALKENASFGLGAAGGTIATEAVVGAAGAIWAGGAGVTAGAVWAGAVGAALGPFTLAIAGGYIAYALISAWMSKKAQTTPLDIAEIRRTVSTIISTDKLSAGGASGAATGKRFTKEVKDKFWHLAHGNKNEPGEAANIKINVNGTFAGLAANTEAAKKNTQQLLDSVGKLEIVDASETGAKTAPIFFTTLGEIMKILTLLDPSGNLTILSGGYFIDTNPQKPNQEIAFSPFSTLPITINSLSKFLYKHLEEMDRNFNYDSELFFRDVYENLVKAAIVEGHAKLPSLKNATPNNLRVTSTLHLDGGSAGAINSWAKDTDLLDPAAFKSLKMNFIRSKNLNITKGNGITNGKIAKIYVMGTIEEVEKYDFFGEYKGWASGNIRYVLNSHKFQEFINTQHLIPCILIKNIANTESVLRKKTLNFSRIDNQNLETGQFLNGFGQLRYSYQFKSDLKPYMNFFVDIGSHIFVAPPGSNTPSQVNMFGYGGLYIIRGSEFEYSFQRLQDGKITIPALEAKCSIDAYQISAGDGINPDPNNTKGNASKGGCEENGSEDPMDKANADRPARYAFATKDFTEFAGSPDEKVTWTEIQEVHAKSNQIYKTGVQKPVNTAFAREGYDNVAKPHEKKVKIGQETGAEVLYYFPNGVPAGMTQADLQVYVARGEAKEVRRYGRSFGTATKGGKGVWTRGEESDVWADEH